MWRRAQKNVLASVSDRECSGCAERPRRRGRRVAAVFATARPGLPAGVTVAANDRAVCTFAPAAVRPFPALRRPRIPPPPRPVPHVPHWSTRSGPRSPRSGHPGAVTAPQPCITAPHASPPLAGAPADPAPTSSSPQCRLHTRHCGGGCGAAQCVLPAHARRTARRITSAGVSCRVVRAWLAAGRRTRRGPFARDRRRSTS